MIPPPLGDNLLSRKTTRFESDTVENKRHSSAQKSEAHKNI